MAFASNSIAQARSRKKLLLGSAAGLALLVGATGAQAQDGPVLAENAPQSGPQFVENVPHTNAPTPAQLVENAPQVVVQGPGEGYNVNPGTEGSIYDDAVDVTGVGQFYRADGFVCTGTLINPRTVIFAAHCVNDLTPDSYGAATGGIPAAFSFKADAVGGLIDWINAGYNSVPDSYVYNVNQIIYNPESIERPEDLGFLQGDVAMASLDTPAANVPTWALLFSALPAPGSIDSVDGTGYHVRVNGYGVTGYGNGPIAGGVDFRRRAAENMIGILGSLSDRGNALFGTLLGFPGYPDDTYQQNLYQLDFDDPTRENPLDFNIFRDDARDPEGTTAGGDSGGPLILDETFDTEVVIGVLSGGSRYYGAGQPFSTYGTSSFYQPLYLFWDWIAANSPYRYTTAAAGDGQWTDPEHWVTALDPNFMIIEDGQLVNGIPDTPGAGAFGEDDTTKFGAVCDGSGYCVDLSTGEVVEYDDWGGPGVGETDGGATVAGGDTNGIIRVGDLGAVAENAAQSTGGDTAVPAGTVTTAALPEGTLENGLPGGTGYVPNNVDYDPEAGVNSRYFDVTLAAAGTTTLSDAEIEIDNLTLRGTETGLVIDEDALLWSNMGIAQWSGMVTVDGVIGTYGDYSLISGGVMGNGTIVAPYFDNVMGVIAPGTPTTNGTLSFYGNYISASASTYLASVGLSGDSDLIGVNATMADNEGVPLDGIANLGGTLSLVATSGTMIREGYTYTLVTAEGGVSGEFDAVTPLSAILTPVVSYSANAVSVEVQAGDYSDVIDGSSPVQSAYAKLLDRNRSNYDHLADLYGPLDLYSGPAIQAALESWAPRSQALTGSMSMVALDTLAGMITQRSSAFASGASTPGDETTAFLPFAGNPMGTVMTMTSGYASNVADNGMQMEDHAVSDKASVYLAGGYIDGESDAGIPSTAAGVTDDFDGWYATVGVEAALGSNSMLGFAVSYAQLDGSTTIGGQSSKATLYQGTLYGVSNLGPVTFDTLFSAGLLDPEASRTAALGGTTYTLHASDNPLTITGQLGLSAPMDMGSVTLTPRASIRYMTVDYTPTAETGGPMALQYDMGKFKSFQGRVGATLSGNGTFRPFLSANYVHDFDERPMAFSANFVGGVGAPVGFALNGTDQDWAEVSGGIAYDTPKVRVALSANTTIERSDIENRSYQGSVTFRF